MSGALEKFPPVLAFQSAIDATVSTPALISRLFDRLPEKNDELVLFGLNRVDVIEQNGRDRQLASSICSSKRGQAVRVGMANVAPASEDLTWADARKATLLKARPVSFPIQVETIEEFGILPSSIHVFSEIDDAERRQAALAEERFVHKVNRALAASERKSIYLYIHGYKTSFENPILTSAELWHFLGNEGSFIAYSWPATPKALAYFADAETAQTSARNLRRFLRFLAEKTNAKNINIIAYSAGNRVLSQAPGDLALEERETPPSVLRQKLKIGTVALMASDVDRGIFAGYLTDGLLKLVGQLIVYQSDADWALRVSCFRTNSARVGQSLDPDEIKPAVLRFLRRHPKFAIVDVSDAELARNGNGHSYLRSSPWVSSDLLLTLGSNKGPAGRGLVKKEDHVPVWVFPPDYITRLRSALIQLDLNLAR